MNIRIAEKNENEKVLKHYQECNYGAGINKDDLVIIAIDKEIVGAVRICVEQNIRVLRGMQVKKPFQRNGIGSLMLKYLEENLDLKDCYCLPYKHLREFYAQVGFEEVLPRYAPRFLAERLENYLSGGYGEIIIMKVSK